MGTATAAPGGLRIERLDRERWTEAAATFADHNYRQSWDFGIHAAARVGAVSEHVAILDGGRPVALADVRVRSVPLVGGIAYVTGGPLARAGASLDPSSHLSAIDALRREYAVRRGLLLRIVPPVGSARWNAELADGLARAGFVPGTASPGYPTMLVAIDPPESEIRRRFHQKWRNCLNRSEREGLTVRESRDVEGLGRFAALFDAFVARKGFEVRLDAAFHLRVQRDLPESERFVVLLAEHEGTAIAGLVASVLGDTAVYLLGASSPDSLPKKAAYLLQWHAIRAARERGCVTYDLGGVDAIANPGVFHFKSGLGGEAVAAAGPVEWRGGPRARLVLALEAGRRAAARWRP